MVSKKKVSKAAVATTAVATFGAAMTSMYLAPEMQADIVDLTFNGGATATNPFFNGSQTAGMIPDIEIDQVPNVVGTGGDFAQWNDTFNGTGRTLAISGSAVAGNILSHVANGVMVGDMIDPGTFAGTAGAVGGGSTGGATTNVMGTFDGSGTAFVAFRTAAGNVGWYQLSFTVAGPITYGPGQLGSMGETVTVGGDTGSCAFELGDVNNDGAINLLDVQPFVNALPPGDFVCEADINGDGAVTLLDVAGFVTIISGG